MLKYTPDSQPIKVQPTSEVAHPVTTTTARGARSDRRIMAVTVLPLRVQARQSNASERHVGRRFGSRGVELPELPDSATPAAR